MAPIIKTGCYSKNNNNTLLHLNKNGIMYIVMDMMVDQSGATNGGIASIGYIWGFTGVIQFSTNR